MHICRGNFRSTWFSSGGYEPVAKTLFGHCRVDGFFLEYDSDRAGGISLQKQSLFILLKRGEKEEREEGMACQKKETKLSSLPYKKPLMWALCWGLRQEGNNLKTMEEKEKE